MKCVLAWPGVVGKAKEVYTNATRRLPFSTKVRYIADTREHHHAVKDGKITRPERVWKLTIGPYLPARRSLEVLRAVDDDVHSAGTCWGSTAVPADVCSAADFVSTREPIQTIVMGIRPSLMKLNKRLSESAARIEKQVKTKNGDKSSRLSPGC